jgi:hypothetical protein
MTQLLHNQQNTPTVQTTNTQNSQNLTENMETEKEPLKIKAGDSWDESTRQTN